MERKKLLKFSAFLVLFIFVLNSLANVFYWYSSVRYFDVLMHLLGGVWLGLLFVYFFYQPYFNFSNIIKLSLWVLFVGILWEIFELYFVNYVAINTFDVEDTLADLFFDLLGGCLALFYLSKRMIVPLNENKVE